MGWISVRKKITIRIRIGKSTRKSNSSHKHFTCIVSFTTLNKTYKGGGPIYDEEIEM